MKCRYPVVITIEGKMTPVGCGQCMPCRINRSRVWQHRLMLESSSYEFNSFITNTFRDPAPEKAKIDDSKKYIKRLRRSLEPKKIRFFGIGEYGERRHRPHYHYAIFNHGAICRSVGDCVEKKTGKQCYRLKDSERRCVFVKSWKFGNVFVGDLNKDSARYLTGYITKKEDSEFSHMSLKPGLGVKEIMRMSKIIKGSKYYNERVISTLKHGKVLYPLGKYLKGVLNNEIGTSGDLLDMELETYRSVAVGDSSPMFWEKVQGAGRRVEHNNNYTFRKRRLL